VKTRETGEEGKKTVGELCQTSTRKGNVMVKLTEKVPTPPLGREKKNPRGPPRGERKTLEEAEGATKPRKKGGARKQSRVKL